MKKIAALVLCLALMGSLFAGCQQKPKEIPPYFPHSNSVRLDIGEQDIIDQNLGEGDEDSPGWYRVPQPVSVDGVSFDLTYMLRREDTISGYYMNTDNELDVPAAYKQLVKHFNDLYGKGEKVETTSDWQTDFTGTKWVFPIDTGEEYRLTLEYYHSTYDDKGNAPYHLAVLTSRSDIL